MAADSHERLSDDDEVGEVTCQGHDHMKKVTHDDVYFLSVDTMYEFLFTDSSFIRSFWETRKRHDIDLVEWQDDPDENVKRSRVIKYAVPLNASFGPKTSLQVEKQICYSHGKEGVTYILDTETTPKGIPYEDTFFIASRYCLTRVSKCEVRLRVTSEVRFRKNLFSFMKNMIDKTSIQGVVDYFDQLGVWLRRESDKRQKEYSLQNQTKTPKVPRRETLTSQSEGPNTTSQKVTLDNNHVEGYTRRSRRKKRAIPVAIPKSKSYVNVEPYNLTDTTFLLPAACVTLILLVMFNALLFYKLWSLENLANVLYFPHPKTTMDNFLKHSPQTKEEWVSLIRRQQEFHESETKQWENMIVSSLSLADKMQATLENLKAHIETRPETLMEESLNIPEYTRS